jgi:hypothetical protein
MLLRIEFVYNIPLMLTSLMIPIGVDSSWQFGHHQTREGHTLEAQRGEAVDTRSPENQSSRPKTSTEINQYRGRGLLQTQELSTADSREHA